MKPGPDPSMGCVCHLLYRAGIHITTQLTRGIHKASRKTAVSLIEKMQEGKH